MVNSPFPIDADLTAVAVAYKNAAYIADTVAPRIRVGKQEFKFISYSDDKFFTIPDTLVGRRSKPNEVDFDGQEMTDATVDYGLDGSIPQADVENADERYNPLAKRVELLTELVALDRERRVAGLLFNANSYVATFKQTLTGTGQFSDYANSDPLGIINDALDQPLMRPNQIVIGQSAWTKLKAHPKIVKAVFGNAGDSGNATREQVARLFEVDEVVVGQARANSNKPGQTTALYRLWGKHMALVYKAPVPDSEGAVTFAGTFQWGDQIAGQMPDPDIGLRGGTKVRSGESVKERIIANQAGYFLQNVVA